MTHLIEFHKAKKGKRNFPGITTHSICEHLGELAIRDPRLVCPHAHCFLASSNLQYLISRASINLQALVRSSKRSRNMAHA